MKPASRTRRTARAAFAVLLALPLFACGEDEPEKAETEETTPAPTEAADAPALERVDFAALDGWLADDPAEALVAFRRSCRVFAAMPAEKPVGKDGIGGVARDWQLACNEADGVPDPAGGIAADRVRAYFESWFVPFRVNPEDGAKGLFTGYYEAELRGARQPGAPYEVPLWGVPEDLVTVDLGDFRDDLDGIEIAGRLDGRKLVPYHDRRAIDAGVLDGVAEPVLWVDDPVDAFFLHIQGSGRVKLADGTTTRVGYAASNGRRFVGIGKLMLERGLIAPAAASMQSIRDWLRGHPHAGRALMEENPRYIFFREVAGAGPIGAQGVALVAGRSLAVDRAHIPLGAPVWLETNWPGDRDRRLHRLMIAQDTGAAITGRVRGDFFWGAGEPALEQAGRMKEPGGYYLLLPKDAAARLTPQG